jgi:hypothetical protein
VEDENNINIHSVSKHFDNVLEELIKKYWNNWWNISHKDFIKNQDDLFINIAFITYKELWRFEKSFGEFYKKYRKNDIKKMVKWNIQKAKEYNKEEVVSKAIEIFFNKSSLSWKALYETMFFYLWWKKVKELDWVWFWVDRDHDLFQTTAFSLGYNQSSIESNVPFLYARRTWKKSQANLSNLSFRQFWHYYK